MAVLSSVRFVSFLSSARMIPFLITVLTPEMEVAKQLLPYFLVRNKHLKGTMFSETLKYLQLRGVSLRCPCGCFLFPGTLHFRPIQPFPEP